VTVNETDVIYDWNVRGHAVSPPMRAVELHDETLRDGIQSPSVHDPPLQVKQEVVRLLAGLGVYSVNVGLPGAGPRAVADSRLLVETVRDEKLPIRVGAAARTHPNDIRPIVEITQQTGVPVEIMTFLGSSPIRMYAEGWDEDKLEGLTREAVKLGVSGGCPVSFVTEDTVRSHPATLRRLFSAAVEEGASRLVLCDTVGHSTPNGAFNLIHFAHDVLLGLGVRDRVKLDWHGHNDRGLALPNALAAVEAGADRVHGTVLGVGERVGNTSLDQMLVNLKLLGHHDGDLSALSRLVALIGQHCNVPPAYNYPVFGRDAFRTGTGVHAAAVVKAEGKGDNWLADRIYSGVPASWFGREQEIEIGHQSGVSNVRYWLQRRGLSTDEKVVQAIFDAAKGGNRLLEEAEIRAVIESIP
jgi:2-isopropylmalate synthase